MRPALAMLTILGAGCTPAALDGVALERAGEAMPDFTLVDTNTTSPTSGQSVSVSDQRGRVSAWYFGHAT
jgi:hypothetical protein